MRETGTGPLISDSSELRIRDAGRGCCHSPGKNLHAAGAWSCRDHQVPGDRAGHVSSDVEAPTIPNNRVLTETSQNMPRPLNRTHTARHGGITTRIYRDRESNVSDYCYATPGPEPTAAAFPYPRRDNIKRPSPSVRRAGHACSGVECSAAKRSKSSTHKQPTRKRRNQQTNKNA